MATSNRDPRHSREHRTVDRTISRYDLLLMVIPAVFLVALLVWYVSSIPMSTSIGAASLVCSVAVADGLFVNPPFDPEQ